jgi:hypothetical protein
MMTHDEINERLMEAMCNLPATCYRMKGNDGHYRIKGLDADADGHVTVQLIHGRDSYMPGVFVYGVETDELQRCACGRWEKPLPEQIEETKRWLRERREL